MYLAANPIYMQSLSQSGQVHDGVAVSEEEQRMY